MYLQMHLRFIYYLKNVLNYPMTNYMSVGTLFNLVVNGNSDVLNLNFIIVKIKLSKK